MNGPRIFQDVMVIGSWASTCWQNETRNKPRKRRVFLNEVIILKSILRGYYYLKITMKELLPSVW